MSNDQLLFDDVDDEIDLNFKEIIVSESDKINKALSKTTFKTSIDINSNSNNEPKKKRSYVRRKPLAKGNRNQVPISDDASLAIAPSIHDKTSVVETLLKKKESIEEEIASASTLQDDPNQSSPGVIFLGKGKDVPPKNISDLKATRRKKQFEKTIPKKKQSESHDQVDQIESSSSLSSSSSSSSSSQISLSSSSSSSSSENIEEKLKREYGAGFMVGLNLGQTMPLPDFLTNVVAKRQHENIQLALSTGRVNNFGLILNQQQQQQSSVSSSSIFKAKASHFDQSPEELMEVGSVPLDILLNYMQTKIASMEQCIDTSVFETCVRTTSPKPCPREHVNKVLCEPYGPFRQCKLGEKCQSYRHFKFVMMEYLDPKKFEIVEAGGTSLSGESDYCYICHLYNANQYAINTRYYVSTVAFMECPFFHYVDVPGEYVQRAMVQLDSASTDVDLREPVSSTYSVSTGATHGLVQPIRVFAVNDYTTSRMIKDYNGAQISVLHLEEKPDLIYEQHDTQWKALDLSKPFFENYVTIVKADTMSIVARLFSKESVFFITGRCRFGASRRAKTQGSVRAYLGGMLPEDFNPEKPPFSHFTLHRYWCISEPKDVSKYLKNFLSEMEPVEYFPWHYIFTKDLRDSVVHIREIVRGGRISIEEILNGGHDDLAITTNLGISLSYYENMLDDPKISCRLYYIALKIRMVVLNTIIKLYPKSGHTVRDSKVHHRVQLILDWYKENHCQYITASVFDRDISDALLDRLKEVPIRYHYYDSDTRFYEIKRTLHRRETPSEFLIRKFPAYSFYFMEFSKMLKKVQSKFERCGNVLSYFKDIDTSKHFRIASEVNESLDREKLENEDYQKVYEWLLSSKNYSIYITCLVRVNVALEFHEQLLIEVNMCKMHMKACERSIFSNNNDDDGGKEEFVATHDALEIKLKKLRTLRYNLRLFAFTHMDLLQRMYDINDFTDVVLYQRVNRENPNYALSHYTENYPFPTRTPHEGLLPDFTKIIHLTHFPNPIDISTRNANAPTHELLKMLSNLYPREQQPRYPFNKHHSMCCSTTSYCRLAMKAVELTLLGGYHHSDQMPKYEQCIGIHRAHNIQASAERFNEWQKKMQSISILAMREFLVHMIKLTPAYDDYLVTTYPYWHDFCVKVYGAADLMRGFYGEYCHTETLKYMVTTIFRPSSDRSALATKYSQAIEDAGLYEEIDFSCVRQQKKIDGLRVFCRHLEVINKERAKRDFKRHGITQELSTLIEKRVRLIPPGSPICPSWLEEFNFTPEYILVTPETIELVKFAFFFILLGSNFDEYVKLALTNIPISSYEIVDAFFNHLHVQYCITSYALDDTCREMQLDALYRRYKMKGALSSRFCASPQSLIIAPCCNEVKSYISQNCNNPSLGSGHLGVCIYTGKIVDRQKKQFGGKKSERVKSQFCKELEAACLRENKQQLINLCERISNMVPMYNQKKIYGAQLACGSVPMMFVPLLGRVVEVKAFRISKTNAQPAVTAYSICTVCGSVTKFSPRLFGVNGLDCQYCDVAHTSQYRIPSCLFCYKKINMEMCDFSKLDIGTADCPKEDSRQAYYSKVVIDDRDDIGDFKFKRLYICHHCLVRVTSRYAQCDRFLYTAKELIRCKLFEESELILEETIRTGGDVKNYFTTVKIDPRKSEKAKKSLGKIKHE